MSNNEILKESARLRYETGHKLPLYTDANIPVMYEVRTYHMHPDTMDRMKQIVAFFDDNFDQIYHGLYLTTVSNG